MKVLLMARLFGNHSPYVAQFETTLSWLPMDSTDPASTLDVLPECILEVSMMTENGVFRQQFPEPELMEAADGRPMNCR
jgi:hypothetical protein